MIEYRRITQDKVLKIETTETEIKISDLEIELTEMKASNIEIKGIQTWKAGLSEKKKPYILDLPLGDEKDLEDEIAMLKNLKVEAEN